MLIYSLVAGVLFGLYFTLIGIGLNLIFGVMRLVNLAHGDFVVVGGFLACGLFLAAGINPLLTAGMLMVPMFFVGVALYYGIVRKLRLSRDSEMLSLILFFGLSKIMEAAAGLVLGTSEQSIPSYALAAGPMELLGQSFPKTWIYAAVVSAIVVVGVYFYLYRTKLGVLTRAVMDNHDEAVMTGINVDRICAIALGVSLSLAGIAGVFAPFMLGSITPATGVDLSVAAFAVIVIGTLGNPLGTALGGIVYGTALMLMQTYMSSWANVLPNILLIAVLLVRPQGLLARQVRSA
jgi:branched-chain amino acid transport system permease protein